MLVDEDHPAVDELAGNVLTACCSLHGIVAEEIARENLDYNDPDFEVIVTVRAKKGIPPG